MPSHDHQLRRLRRLRFELGRELGPREEARRTAAAEMDGRDAARLVEQRRAEEFRRQTERRLAVSLRPWRRPPGEG
jgi:hypothetical protein